MADDDFAEEVRRLRAEAKRDAADAPLLTREDLTLEERAYFSAARDRLRMELAGFERELVRLKGKYESTGKNFVPDNYPDLIGARMAMTDIRRFISELGAILGEGA